MIFPEKSQGLVDTNDGKSRETEVLPSSSPRVYQPSGPSPTFPEKAPSPPLIRLEYYPESSSAGSRAIVSPTFPTPFDNNPPPPSYYPDGSASSSHFSSASSIINAEMPIPTIARPQAAPGSHPSFARAPSSEMTYPSFSPMYLVATGKSLAKGFPIILPASNSNPHPFASHDVYEVDWKKYFLFNLNFLIGIDWRNFSFLWEVQMVAALSPKQIELSEHLPILSIVPIVSELQIKAISITISLG